MSALQQFFLMEDAWSMSQNKKSFMASEDFSSKCQIEGQDQGLSLADVLILWVGLVIKNME